VEWSVYVATFIRVRNIRPRYVTCIEKATKHACLQPCVPCSLASPAAIAIRALRRCVRFVIAELRSRLSPASEYCHFWLASSHEPQARIPAILSFDCPQSQLQPILLPNCGQVSTTPKGKVGTILGSLFSRSSTHLMYYCIGSLEESWEECRKGSAQTSFCSILQHSPRHDASYKVLHSFSPVMSYVETEPRVAKEGVSIGLPSIGFNRADAIIYKVSTCIYMLYLLMDVLSALHGIQAIRSVDKYEA